MDFQARDRLTFAASRSHNLGMMGLCDLMRERFLELALSSAYTSSAHGWTNVDGAEDAVETLLSGFEVNRTRHNQYRAWFAKPYALDPDVCVFAELHGDGDWSMWASGSASGAVDALVTRFEAAFPGAERTDGNVFVTFHCLGPMGPISYTRQLAAGVWADTAANYPQAVRDRLGVLMAMDPPDAGGRLVLLHGPPGTGKGLPLDTPILTPSGWRGIGDLCVGDELVGRDGHPTTVVRIYDRGEQPVYRVSFTDGASVVCDGDHLWSVQSRKMRQTGNFVVKSTSELFAGPVLEERGESRRPQPRWLVPLVEPVQHDKIELPIEPYLLGVLLANGSFTSRMLAFTTNDELVARRCIDGSPHLTFRENTSPNSTARRWTIAKFHPALEALGLDEHLSRDKFIPAPYLVADESSRRDLLAGLVDCDGSARGTRKPGYYTTSPRLAEGVTALVRSLGGVAHLRVDRREPVTYEVAMSLPTSPFSLDRKRALDRYAGQPRRGIASVEPVGAAVTRCIEVDADDQLFVADQYLVTHNTHCVRALAQAWGEWADVDYVVDPDAFFEWAHYMVSTMVMGGGERWRLVVLEDSGEFLTVQAGQKQGGGLGRLLNLADGLVGQGLNLIVLMSTNEPIESLHPALTRPGRCLASIEFPAFEVEEANQWLAGRSRERVTESATLAELYQLTRP